MRWTRDARIRTVARRGTGMALLVLVLGFFLVLDWAGTEPREVITPEGGGHAWQVSSSAGGRSEILIGDRGPAAPDSRPAVRRGATTESTSAQTDQRAKAAQQINPLATLVDGTGFVRFLGFTAISLGFAVVVLVFFWSHRRDPLS